MGENGTNERTTYRLRRWIGGSAGIGAAAVVLMMALAPATAASSGNLTLHGASWYPSHSLSVSGCATGNSKAPGFHTASGLGYWDGTIKGKTCSKAKGGVSTGTYGSASGEISVKVPLKLKASTNGVNVTWNIKASIATSGGTHASSVSCPVTTYSYSYYYNNSWYVYNYSTGNYSYVSTWYNYTDKYADCYVEGEAAIYGYSYIIDTTSGAYLGSSNYWPGANNISGFSSYRSAYYVNYSNPAAGTSYTYSYNYTTSWGSPGAVSGTWTPTWFINGTFMGTHKYVLNTYISNSVFADIYGVKAAYASASLNAHTVGNHEDLTGITVW